MICLYGFTIALYNFNRDNYLVYVIQEKLQGEIKTNYLQAKFWCCIVHDFAWKTSRRDKKP